MFLTHCAQRATIEANSELEGGAGMGWLGWLRGRPAAPARVTEPTGVVRLPEDVSERNPLDIWHFVAAHAFSALILAPVDAPRAVLDVACGTGRWARDVARLYPQARVFGFDLNTQQIDKSVEEDAWRGDDLLSPNCTFLQADALRQFPYQDAVFDYTHARFFSPFVPAVRFLPMLGEMVRVTRPGGWVELLDVAQFSSPEPGRQYLLDCLRALYQRTGLVLEPGQHLEVTLRQMELLRVQSRSVEVRAEAGADVARARLAADLLAGLTNAADHYVQAGIAPADSVAAAVKQAQTSQAGATLHVALTSAWGQRPSGT
jgi:ubiquinone/menaquinone biosynthesis C-methylase UbiE